MWKGPVGFAETYSRIIFSVSTFLGFPNSFGFSKISPTRFDSSFSPALKLINPATTEYWLSSCSTNSTIALQFGEVRFLQNEQVKKHLLHSLQNQRF